MGLIKHGSIVVPFDNLIDHDNDLYKLFSTNLQGRSRNRRKRHAPGKNSSDMMIVVSGFSQETAAMPSYRHLEQTFVERLGLRDRRRNH